MKQSQIFGIVRHALSTIGAFVVYKGYLSDEDVMQFIGSAMALFAVVWSFWEKNEVPINDK